IPTSAIASFLEAQELLFTFKDLQTTITVQYVEMSLDGVLDEEEWAANTYSTKNTENNVSQIIHSYFGNTGLYFGIKVTDPNVVSDSDLSRLELYFNIGEAIGVGNTWGLRLFASGNVKTYVYKEPVPGGSTFLWAEKTGDNKLNVTSVVSLTDNGYDLEVYIPYSTLGLTEKPAVVDVLSYLCFVKEGATGVTSMDGENSINNSYSGNLANFVEFNENGFEPKAIYVDNILLGNADLSDGYFVKEFEIYAADNKENKFVGVGFTSEYLLEIGNGVYKLSIPTSAIASFLEAQELLFTFKDLQTTITVQYVEMSLDGVLDEEA
ncbi:MAG: hypothetical protein PHS54_05955, partial [Clostridia bacterium]|nr:hypothetical protein [Clostridia bacterium]